MPGAPKRRQRFDAKRCMARFDFLNRQQ
jgi:hypothetical protein